MLEAQVLFVCFLLYLENEYGWVNAGINVPLIP